MTDPRSPAQFSYYRKRQTPAQVLEDARNIGGMCDHVGWSTLMSYWEQHVIHKMRAAKTDSDFRYWQGVLDARWLLAATAEAVMTGAEKMISTGSVQEGVLPDTLETVTLGRTIERWKAEREKNDNG